MSAGKYLIVNADDFGLSPGINTGIATAHRDGIVTSASLMVRGRAAEEAVQLGRQLPDLSLGLHIDLGEWSYGDGQWQPLYEVVSTSDATAVRGEILHQLDVFRALVGRDPTHVDSHQHVHLDEPVRAIAREIVGPLGVPLRNLTRGLRYCGEFYGQTGEGLPLPEAITPAALTRLLNELPDGVTELGCHPGLDNDLATMYREERRQEVATLCGAQVRAAIDSGGIELISFGDLSRNRLFESDLVASQKG